MKKGKLLLCIILMVSGGIQAQNVGIGTNSPVDKLSVITQSGVYGFTHSTGTITVGSYVSSAGGEFGTKTDNPLHFFTNNNSPQITLLQNGKVGIGTTSPSDKLEIITSNSNFGFTHSDGTIKLSTYLSSTAAQLGTKSNHPLQFFTNDGNAQITLLQNGNVGFGTTTPLTDLHINPAGAGSILLGTNKTSSGYTSLEMGITAQSSGYSYIQSTQAAGSTWGKLLLNGWGGFVGINHTNGSTVEFPLDINQTSEVFGLRLRNVIGVGGNNNWDMYAGNYGGLYFSYNGVDRSFITWADGSLNSVSDLRLKKNITPMASVLEKVMALQPKNYQYISNKQSEEFCSGFIAQEVIPLFPELVHEFMYPSKDTTDKNIYHGLNYAGFGVIAIKAIQEQQKEIESSHAEIKLMMEEMKKMHTEMDALKQQVNNTINHK